MLALLIVIGRALACSEEIVHELFMASQPDCFARVVYVRDSGRAVRRFEQTDGVISAIRYQGVCLHLATISVTSSRCS
jgi:hypothetical protein